MKRALLLGAGLVSRPLVAYLLEHGIHLTIATRTRSKAEAMLGGHRNGRAVAWTVEQPAALEQLVGEVDLAISLLPAVHHPLVAAACVKRGKHMVTTSYVSDAMRALDGEARAKGLTLLNEIGVDPGIDHMSAMQIIGAVQRRGGVVTSFKSYCGGLPAPDAKGPWQYKFSWTPRGVLLAARNGARLRQDGALVDIPPADLFKHSHMVAVEGFGELEAYYNRDSLPYIELYGLGGVRTMFRGTLRYPGWSDTMWRVRRLGLLELDELHGIAAKPYRHFMARVVGCAADGDVRAAVAAAAGVAPGADLMVKLEALGLFGDDPVGRDTTALDVLAERMAQVLQYQPGERDLIVMVHQFEVEYPAGAGTATAERITSTLIDYGIPGGDTSMARTVSLPAAIATRLILEGRIDRAGVLIPVTPDLYDPVMAELATLGIAMRERRAAGTAVPAKQ